jgi:transmembrane sensor
VNDDVDDGPTGSDRWAEALTWHVTLREAAEKDLTSAVGREWQKWHADPENQRVFDDVSRLLADRDLYRRCRRPSRAELLADRYDLSGPIAEWRKASPPRVAPKQGASSRYWRGWLSSGLAVATLAATAVLVMRLPLRFWPGAGQRGPVIYQTSVGELRNVHLPDGSSIILGGRTELSVAFSAQRRSVGLLRGEAWFQVAHHSYWPFVVAAGDGTITDVGTAFLVQRDSDRVVVTVTQGTVEITPGPLARSTPGIDEGVALAPVLSRIRVTQGEEFAFSDKGALSAVKQTDTHAATTWTHGRLTFDDVPLRYVVERVDRYSSRHIAVSASAGTLRFSGIVSDDGIDDWLQGLEKIFPVTVDEREATVCVHMRDLSPKGGSSDATCTTRW